MARQSLHKGTIVIASGAAMARYKPVDPHLSNLLAVRFSEQIVPGTFEYAAHWLVDHQIDVSVLDERYPHVGFI